MRKHGIHGLLVPSLSMVHDMHVRDFPSTKTFHPSFLHRFFSVLVFFLSIFLFAFFIASNHVFVCASFELIGVGVRYSGQCLSLNFLVVKFDYDGKKKVF